MDSLKRATALVKIAVLDTKSELYATCDGSAYREDPGNNVISVFK